MDRKRWAMLILATCGAVALTSVLWWLTAKPLVAETAQETTALLRHGKKVFRQAGCWYCHHPSLSGLRWGEIASPFANESGWVAYFYNPKALRPQSSKSAYRGLLKQHNDGRMTLNYDGRALIAYLRKAQRSSFVPGQGSRRLIPLSTKAQSQQGLQLYQTLCASCHGTRGFGDGPLAKKLPTPPRDLTKPKAWLCRSYTSANVKDIYRTLEHQTGGCGMVSLRDSLSQEQRRSLADAVRRIAGMNKKVSSHPALAWKKPKRPNYTELRKRAFRDWTKKMWERGYDRWLATWRRERGTKEHVPFRHWRNWRDWTEWQSFGLWARRHSPQLRIARGDWRAFLQQSPRLRHIFQLWLEKGRKKPWIKFMKQILRRDLKRDLERKYQAFLKSRKMEWPTWTFTTIVNPVKWWRKWEGWRHRSNWMKYELRRQWSLWLQRYDFQEYNDWRERQERDLFRDWRDKQSVELYWAWRGQKIYVGMGCSGCHGKSGEGKLLYINPGSDRKKQGPSKPVALKVRNLHKGALRCGSRWEHVYRSIVVGVGRHMKGLSSRELLHYVKGAKLGRNPWKDTKPRDAKRLRVDLWALAAYIRYTSFQVPIMRAMQRD